MIDGNTRENPVVCSKNVNKIIQFARKCKPSVLTMVCTSSGRFRQMQFAYLKYINKKNNILAKTVVITSCHPSGK